MKKSDGDWWKKLPDNCALIRGSNAGRFIYCLGRNIKRYVVR